jgi:multiple sugar transport system substrate-binding protein
VKKSLTFAAAALAGGLALTACGSSTPSGGSSTSAPATSASSAPSSAPSSDASSSAPSSDASSSAPSSGGSSDSSAPALADATIKILAPAYADSSQSDWETIIKGFNAKYPNIKVELQIEAWDGFTDKVQARIQANDAPDILNDNNFSESAQSGLLYPITDVMSPETLATIEPALNKNGQGPDGTQWAAPDIATARLLAYNTDLFKAAGITAAPTTWDEMLADAQKLSTNGVAGYGMPLGKEEAQSESTVWVWGAGGTWVDGEKLKANTPAAIEGFTEMKKFIDAKATQPNVGSSNRQAVADLFNQGKVAMFVSHPGLTSTTLKDFKNIKFDLAPIPSKDGKGVAYGVTDFILAFNNKDDARKAATKAFLDYFYSPDVYAPWAKATGLLPVTTTAIAEATKDQPQNAKFLEALKTVQFTPSGNPQWTALQNALQSTAGQIESKSPQEVLDTIQAQLDAAG